MTITYYYFTAATSACCGDVINPCAAPPDQSANLAAALAQLHLAGYTELSSGTDAVIGADVQTLAPRYFAWGAPVLRPPGVTLVPNALPGYAQAAYVSLNLYDDALVADPFDGCAFSEANNYNQIAWYIVAYDPNPVPGLPS